MFSIYILTYNEELDIAACIESAQLSDDVIVVDSISSDRTVEIAAHYPVQIVQHALKAMGDSAPGCSKKFQLSMSGSTSSKPMNA
jgi:glycosyltransferase involved in cell wall biosynthesis